MPNTRLLSLAIVAAGAWGSLTPAYAGGNPAGLWFDHNGRGAVEIAPCANGKGYCGYVVHITDAKNGKRCGLQILGNVTDAGGGWIYSPDRGKKYSVALTRLSDDKLRVVGNAGSFFSRTYTWKRAPDDIARCGETTAAAPAKPSATPAEKPDAAPTGTQASADTPSPQRAVDDNGPASASVALMAPKPRRTNGSVAVAATAPEKVETSQPPIVQDTAPSPPTQARAEPAKQQAAEATNDDEDIEPAPRKCKFKIPYVGRVISIPCRD